ncbi:MAG TPA: hypothetical protein PLT35_07920 [Vicinamibacterales bacterium]|mgnify:CR=1 FL=1|nr:hypothetical protein [Vicinamibacterales bacterium]
MNRYTRIQSVTFDGVDLPLPLQVRVSRRCEPQAAAGDGDAFVTSVQCSRPVLAAEVRLRGTAAAEALSPGQIGTLTFVVGPAAAGQAPRRVTLAGAVLTGADVAYEQAGFAEATLRFVAEAADGLTDPHAAEDAQ